LFCGVDFVSLKWVSDEVKIWSEKWEVVVKWVEK